MFRVLVVEDNPHVSEIFRYAFKRIVFERLGRAVEVRVEEAGDGHVAWQRLQDAAAHGVGFDLVVLDLMLPVLDGAEVLEPDAPGRGVLQGAGAGHHRGRW